MASQMNILSIRLIVMVMSFCALKGYSQNLIRNGSFESNKAVHSSCTQWWQLSESKYDSLLHFSKAIYYSTNSTISHGIELIDSLCYGVEEFKYPQDSSWYISLNAWNWPSVPAYGYEGVMLALSKPLYTDDKHKVSFYAYSSPFIQNNVNNQVVVGVSSDSTSLGTEVYRTIPDTTDWQYFEFEFTVPLFTKYISVWVEPPTVVHQDLSFIDNIVLRPLDTSNSINEHLLQAIDVYPNPYQETFTISQKDPSISTKYILMYNVIGKEVLNIEHKQLPYGRIEIYTPNINPGVYFLELWGVKDGQEVVVGRSKIVKE